MNMYQEFTVKQNFQAHSNQSLLKNKLWDVISFYMTVIPSYLKVTYADLFQVLSLNIFI